MAAFNQEFRFGSARWADECDIRRAGLFGKAGPLLGFAGPRTLRIGGDAPIITIGGAGSGKLRDLIAYNVCGHPRAGFLWGRDRWIAPRRMFVNDSRGELAAIALANHARLGKAAYCFNAYGLHGLPQHRVNPLDLLRLGSPSLHADITLLVCDLIPLSGSANAEYFELRARQWLQALMHLQVGWPGGITLLTLYDLVNDVQDPGLWPDIAEAMLKAGAETRRTAIEMHTKRETAEKEYGAIMGEIIKSLSFLSDPMVRQAISGADVSLEALCREDCSVFNIVPAEYAVQLAPLNRLIVGAAMLYKHRHPDAPGILFLIDEAATLGRFESLLRGYSYGRGMGIRMWSIWQDTSQITRNFGPGALSTFLGSSQTRQFFGVRDLETARLVSAMLGQETLNFDPLLDQAAARRNMAHAARSLLGGEDPFMVGLNARHSAFASALPQQQARALMTPEEILGMPEDKQILFISGLDLDPIAASKFAYFRRREMAGGYMPNPYHPPADRVAVAGPFGRRMAKVVREPVPPRFESLPQYQSGEWSFVKGYQPR